MHWKVKASLQKVLSATTIGDVLNHIPATLNKKYHYDVTMYQVYECIRKFKHTSIDLSQEKTALEIGTGYSLISAVTLSLLGFQNSITVDITKDIRFSTYRKQIAYLNHPEILELLIDNSIFSKQELLQKIKRLTSVKTIEETFNSLNLTYIAPYQLEDVKKVTNSIDYISSQVVLEHMSPEHLEELFQFTYQVLQEGQFAVHTINFIDHFTNPGFFQDTSISEFNFLKYSDDFWKFWAGNSIAYTNRLSYLYYLELCKKYNLKVVDFIGKNYRIRKELHPELIHEDVIKKYNNGVDITQLTKYQRGTLIISK